jgi:hypothetical protein
MADLADAALIVSERAGDDESRLKALYLSGVASDLFGDFALADALAGAAPERAQALLDEMMAIVDTNGDPWRWQARRDAGFDSPRAREDPRHRLAGAVRQAVVLTGCLTLGLADH